MERSADDIKQANRLEEAGDQVEMEMSWWGKKEMSSERRRKWSSCVKRLKCVSAVVNTGGIHAPLLFVVVFDRAAFHQEAREPLLCQQEPRHKKNWKRSKHKHRSQCERFRWTETLAAARSVTWSGSEGHAPSLLRLPRGAESFRWPFLNFY